MTSPLPFLFTGLRRWLTALLFAIGLTATGWGADDLAALSGNDPWAPHLEFPRLVTPQWVGEPGVEAVVIFAIDDMRDPRPYEAFLRPLLQRLKAIDGRAPVSIMTCKIDPEDPHLQTWLDEGLSLEVHTVDHPCPLLRGGSLPRARSTSERCIDTMFAVPRNVPVCFRMPCCDGQNTVSPRFFDQIFRRTTPSGHFLQCDSSVFNYFTSDDASIPRELAIDEEGRERFAKYQTRGLKWSGISHNQFENRIDNYPYPFVIHQVCWEFPGMAPSDWQAQHFQKPRNPDTLRDLQAGLDITVLRQGVCCIVLHPRLLEPSQWVAFVDHAVARHGQKVKFLTFAEALQRINRNLLAGEPLRDEQGGDNGVRLADVNSDGYMDVLIGNARVQKTRLWDSVRGTFVEQDLPASIIRHNNSITPAVNVRLGRRNREMLLVDRGQMNARDRVWSFRDNRWQADSATEDFLATHGQSTGSHQDRAGDLDLFFHDVDHDGTSELFITSLLDQVGWGHATRVHRWSENHQTWEPLPIEWTQALQRGFVNNSLRLIDLDEDGDDDLVMSDGRGCCVALADWNNSTLTLLIDEERLGSRPVPLPPIRNEDGSDNGFFVRHRQLLWQNEQTDQLDDYVERIPFERLLALADQHDRPMGAPAYAVGAAKADITPSGPIRLSGYGNRKEESTGVAQRIFARAVVIENLSAVNPAPAATAAADERNDARAEKVDVAVIVNVETCGFSHSFRDRLAEELNRRIGIPVGHVVVCATHTHSAPWLPGFAPNILVPTPPEEELQHCQEYETFLFDQLVSVVEQAWQARRPARLGYAQGSVDFAKNRRGRFPGAPQGFPPGQADGPVDHRLPILVARDEEEQVLAVISNYACHCTTLGGEFNQISGDWAGFAQDAIERHFPEAIGMTLIGCGADANPDPRGSMELCTAHGEKLASEVVRLVSGPLEPVRGSLACRFEYVDLPLATPPSRDQFAARADQPAHAGAHARYFLDLLKSSRPLPTAVHEPVGVFTFGDDLAMVFLGGEVVVDYAIQLAELFDARPLWVTSYANAVPCYIPSRRVLSEGGYEGGGAMTYYLLPAPLTPEVEPLLLHTVQRLLPGDWYGEALGAEFPLPREPGESLAALQVPSGFRVELVASEPLVIDPVAFDWGVDGKLWVVEMHDYPNGLADSPENQHALDARVEPGADALPAGRIKFLEDTDGDGTYDRATLFLEGIPFPTGIQCWRDGVLVSAAPDIFFAADTDHDGRADVHRTLYHGFGEGNQQHRVNGLRWGLDNWVYVGNGDSGGEIESQAAVMAATTPPESARRRRVAGLGERLNVSFRDLRIRPDEGWMQTISGMTQFGRERDDWGNWFGNNNSNPMFHYVLDDVYLRRNPRLTVRTTHVDVPEIRGAAPVYPISRTLTRFNFNKAANHFTSACSTMIYRDDCLPALKGNVFTCEPVHNLVSRAIMETDGATFRSHRAEGERSSEFLASRDNWFRPVMIRTGPDGALWVADMYRFVIEHPRWIPDEWKTRLRIRDGDDRGRIYRIVPETAPAPETRGHPLAVLPSRACCDTATSDERPQPDDAISTRRLVLALDSANGWQRDTAHRLLVHRQDRSAIAPLVELFNTAKRPQARLHALCTLDGLGSLQPELLLRALQDPFPAIRRHAIRLSEPFLTKPEIVDGLLNLHNDSDLCVRQQLAYTLGEPVDLDAARSKRIQEVLADLGRSDSEGPWLRTSVLSSLNPENVTGVCLSALTRAAEMPPEYLSELCTHAAALADVAAIEPVIQALLESGSQQEGESWRMAALGSLLQELNQRKISWRSETALRGSAPSIQAELRMAKGILGVEAEPAERRVAAVQLLAAGDPDSEETLQRLMSLLTPREPQQLQSASLQAIGKLANVQIANTLLAEWEHFTPAMRQQMFSLLLGRNEWTMQLLDALESGQPDAAEIAAADRNRLLRDPRPQVRERSERLFESLQDKDRQEILTAFGAALTLQGDGVHGRSLFEQRCASCHQWQGLGKKIGADLAAVKDRSPPVLLAAILDPNRAVESRYLSYSIATVDGRIFAGMLLAETDNSLTLVNARGEEQSLLRSDIEAVQCSGKSFMPEGLEKDLSPQDLADLIAFVAGGSPTPKRVEGNDPAVISPDATGKLTLTAQSASIFGSTLIFEPQFSNLGCWTSADDFATWTLDLKQPGRFRVQLRYACHDSTSGGALQLRAGQNSLKFPVTGTGTWSNYRTAEAGELDLPSGIVTLSARADGQFPSALIDLQSIELLPIP